MIRSAVTAFNVHCSLEIAPAATADSCGDGVLGSPAPAAADGAVNVWMNTLPCKVANSCACGALRDRACNLNALNPAPNPIEWTSHTMSYTMSYAMLYARMYDMQVKIYDVVYDENIRCQTYDIVCTYDIVSYDIVLAWRTTSKYDVVRTPRMTLYGYDVVRAPCTT